MKTVYIESDELYPYFCHYEKEGYLASEVEVSDETIKRWDSISTQFFEYQQELRKLSGYTN